MSVMKTSLTIFPCVLGSAFPIIRVCSGLSFATKGLGHLAALYLLLLLVARYKLSYHKTICYHLFQYLQRIPCWKPLIISFCSSLGSTLLLIERTTINPLYLWVITGDPRPTGGAGQSVGGAQRCLHRRGAPHHYECGGPEGSVRQERTDWSLC